MTKHELLTQLKIFEGFRAYKYICPGGAETVGYGFTASQFPGGAIPNYMTKDEADLMLESLLDKWIEKVRNRLTSWGYLKCEIDVLLYPLTDFAYNCGLGNLDRLTNNGDRTVEMIAYKLPEYNKAGGNVLKGLTTRREWEKEEILKAINSTPAPYTIRDIQHTLNLYYNESLKEDGIIGRKTIDAIMKVLYKG